MTDPLSHVHSEEFDQTGWISGPIRVCGVRIYHIDIFVAKRLVNQTLFGARKLGSKYQIV